MTGMSGIKAVAQSIAAAILAAMLALAKTDVACNLERIAWKLL